MIVHNYVSQVPEDLMTSSNLQEHQAQMWCTYIHTGSQSSHTHKTNEPERKNLERNLAWPINVT